MTQVSFVFGLEVRGKALSEFAREDAEKAARAKAAAEAAAAHRRPRCLGGPGAPRRRFGGAIVRAATSAGKSSGVRVPRKVPPRAGAGGAGAGVRRTGFRKPGLSASGTSARQRAPRLGGRRAFRQRLVAKAVGIAPAPTGVGEPAPSASTRAVAAPRTAANVSPVTCEVQDASPPPTDEVPTLLRSGTRSSGVVSVAAPTPAARTASTPVSARAPLAQTPAARDSAGCIASGPSQDGITGTKRRSRPVDLPVRCLCMLASRHHSRHRFS